LNRILAMTTTRNLALCWIAAISLLALLAATQAQSSPSAGGYRIAGTLVSQTDAHPLARARVTVRSVKNPDQFLSMVTAEDGKFEFSAIPAGKYSLNGAKRGYISAGYDQHDQFSTAIVTGAGLDTETLTLRLAPTALITGKVLDESGDPVRHAMVSVYYDDHSAGVDQIHMHSGAQTNDQGVYEITRLRPGTYFLSVAAKPWYAVHPTSEAPGNRSRSRANASASSVDPSLDVAYATTYYSDATDPESATPIPVRGGERIEVDLHLNPVPALHLLFHVAGNGNNGYVFPQLQQQAFDGDSFVQTNGARMISPGLFEVSGIPAGRYNIRLSGPGTATQMNGIDLTKDGEQIDTSASEPMSSVKVSAQIPGDATPLSQLRIGLRPGHRTMANWKQLDDKGEAQIDQLPAGKYEVQIWGPPKPYSVARISAEGAVISGHTITVAPGSSPSLSLTLVGGSTEVEGIAKRAGRSFAGAMVVLVPKYDPKNPETDHDLFRRDQSDLDGTFVLHNVVPGTYTILAIENGWDLDWSQPNVISAYVPHGRRIEVGSQTARTITVPNDVEVLSK
jgi:hypothetical protein